MPVFPFLGTDGFPVADRGLGYGLHGAHPFGGTAPLIPSPRSIRELLAVNVISTPTLFFNGSNPSVNLSPVVAPVVINEYGYFLIDWDSPSSAERFRVCLAYVPSSVKVSIEEVIFQGNSLTWERMKNTLGDGDQFDRSKNAIPSYDKSLVGSSPYSLSLFVSSPAIIDISAERLNDLDLIELVNLTVIRAPRRGMTVGGSFPLVRGITSLRASIPYRSGTISFNDDGSVID